MDVQSYLRFHALSAMRLAAIMAIVVIVVIGLTAARLSGSDKQASEAAPIALEVGQLFPPRKIAPNAGTIDVWIHFHGHTPVVLKNVRSVSSELAIVIINQPGLSAAYRRPFEDDALLGRVLDEARDKLNESMGDAHDIAWGKIYLSSFSAGYGAVREILKHDRYVEQIDGYVALDSIYAGLVGTANDEDMRVVEPSHMAPFRRFAKLAAEGRKRFVLTHTQLHTPSYASTVETAGNLIAFTGAEAQPIERESFAPFDVLASQRKGSFEVYSCAGDDGEAHMQHLRQMGVWVRQLLGKMEEVKP